MARYTIELRNVIQLYGEETVKSWFEDYELSDYLTPDQIETITTSGVWNKHKLSQMILDHYYMYEIGFETPALFKHQAKVLIRELMEEKAPLIYSAAIKYDPLVNVDYTETFSQTTANTGNSTSNSSGLSVASDTPQGKISKSAILAGDYASSTGADETTDSTNTSANGTQNYVRTTRGNSGVSATAQKMVQQYRENIIMINRDIIKDMRSLFMGVYQKGKYENNRNN